MKTYPGGTTPSTGCVFSPWSSGSSVHRPRSSCDGKLRWLLKRRTLVSVHANQSSSFTWAAGTSSAPCTCPPGPKASLAASRPPAQRLSLEFGSFVRKPRLPEKVSVEKHQQLSRADTSCLKSGSENKSRLLCTINERWSGGGATKISSRGANKANYGALEALWGSWKKRRQIAALGFNNSALTSSTSIHRSVCNQITAMIVAQKPALSNLSNGPFFAQSSSEMSR